MSYNSKEKVAKYMRTRRAKQKLEGICYHCGKQALPTYSLCASCLEKQRDKYHLHGSERANNHRIQGICINCSKPALQGHTRCASCLEVHRKYNETHNQQRNEQTLQFKIDVLKHYSDTLTCVNCGHTKIKSLTLDHINGNGNKQRQSIGLKTGGLPFYQWIKKNNYPSGYQVLCYNCQFVKRGENNEATGRPTHA